MYKKTNREKIFNGDLRNQLENILSSKGQKIKKDKFKNEDGITYTVEVNDSSYLYVNKKERDKDWLNLSIFYMIAKRYSRIQGYTHEHLISYLSNNY
jgi:hypothetical protein